MPDISSRNICAMRRASSTYSPHRSSSWSAGSQLGLARGQRTTKLAQRPRLLQKQQHATTEEQHTVVQCEADHATQPGAGGMVEVPSLGWTQLRHGAAELRRVD